MINFVKENEIYNEILAYTDEIKTWRRQLHKIPELGNNLPNTIDYIKSVLNELCLEFTEYINGNGLSVLIDSGKEGRTIAIRSDMDALPIVEETNLEFSSTNNNMHACGHDGHTAVLIAVGKYLFNNKEKFTGKVKLIFQPGEESPGGAKIMIEEGVLENPKVDAILGLHNGHITDEIPYGHVGITYGPIMASTDVFHGKIIGNGAHGAYPEQGIDPIVISSEVITTLQTIVSRSVKTTDSALLSICSVHGGSTFNIIPDFVEISGTVRTFSKEVQDLMERRMREIMDGVTKAHGASFELDYDRRYPATINDEDFTHDFKRSILKLLSEERIVELKSPVMGAEDMSFYLEKVPGNFFFFNNPKEIDGKIWPHHNSKFDIDEELFPLAASILVQGSLDFLSNK